jgi:hypothetical protein
MSELLTRRGDDWSARFPLVVEAVNHLKVRFCLIDGEVVCCDEKGVAAFHILRRRRNEPDAFLYAFDLLELNGADLRREPIEVRKATLASILRTSRPVTEVQESGSTGGKPRGGRGLGSISCSGGRLCFRVCSASNASLVHVRAMSARVAWHRGFGACATIL